jgi:hypothetical protein
VGRLSVVQGRENWTNMPFFLVLAFAVKGKPMAVVVIRYFGGRMAIMPRVAEVRPWVGAHVLV